MNKLTEKTHATQRGFTYTYYVSPAEQGKPTLLLQHGFPDSAAVWEDLITSHLQPAGYGVIAIDQLGYAGTSKPTDPAAYKLSAIVDDFIDILDAEGLEKVISLGHDWGSRSAQMLYNLHPERVSGLVMVNVGHTPVSNAKFDIDAIIAQAQAAFGSGLIWYWKFFSADDGAKLLREHAGLMFDVFHAPQSWPDILGAEDGMRKVINSQGEGYNLTRRPYATEEVKATFVERMSRDGFEGPVCWYKSFVFGHQDGDGNPDNNTVSVPTLFVDFKDDIGSREEFMIPSIRAGFLPRLTTATLGGAHFGFLEDRKAFGETVLEWLNNTRQ